MCVILDGSNKQHETDVQFKGGSDITKGGDISVIDFPAGFRRACGPQARIQGSFVLNTPRMINGDYEGQIVFGDY